MEPCLGDDYDDLVPRLLERPDALHEYNRLLGEIPYPLLERAVKWPFARLQLSTAVARISFLELRLAYWVHFSSKLVISRLPNAFPTRGCSWCGKPTGNFCDACGYQFIASAVCDDCENQFVSCRGCAERQTLCPTQRPWRDGTVWSTRI